MALIPEGVLKKWQDGDVVDARNLNQLVETMRTAINDNFNRLKAASLPDYVDTYNKFLAISGTASGDTVNKTFVVEDNFKRKLMDMILVSQNNDYFIEKGKETLMALNTTTFKTGTATYKDGKYTLTKSGAYQINLFAECENLDNVGDELHLNLKVYSSSGSVAQSHRIDVNNYMGNGRWVRVGGSIVILCTKGESIGMNITQFASNSQWRAIKQCRMSVVHIADV